MSFCAFAFVTSFDPQWNCLNGMPTTERRLQNPVNVATALM